MSTMGYVTTLTGAEDAASLSLDFEKQSYRVTEGGKLVNKGFSDLITFSRASTGGRWNENGLYESMGVNQPRFDYDPITKVLKGLLLEGQRTNLSPYSESCLVQTTRTSYVSTGEVWVDGASQFKKLVEDNSNNTHFGLPSSVIVQPDTTYTFSYFVKAAGRTKVQFQMQNSASWAGTTPVAELDLATKTFTGTSLVTSMQEVGNGVFRIFVTATTKGAATGTVAFSSTCYPVLKDSTGNTSYAGDGVSGVYIGGYQVEVGSFATTYIPTPATFVSRASTATYFDKNGVLKVAAVNVARTGAYNYFNGEVKPVGLLLESSGTNILPNSSNFSAASWATYSDVSGQPTTTTPNSALSPSGSMDASLVSMSNGNCLLTQNLAVAVSVPYTMSVWMKGVLGGERVSLEFRSVTSAGISWSTPFTLTKEWVRYVVSGMNTDVAGSRGFQFRKNASTAGAQSFHVWGAQVEQSSSVSSYIPTNPTFTSRASTATYIDSAGIIQTAAVNVVRDQAYGYDADGVLRSIGLLMEGTATNFVKFSNGSGTGWSDTSNATNKPVVTPNAAVAPDGTTTATTIDFPSKDAGTTQTWNQQVTGLTSGANLAPSVWVKADRPLTLHLRKGDGQAGYESFSITQDWKRFTPTPGVNSSTVFNFGFAMPAVSATTPSKVYVWGAQLEVGNYPTSDIQTAAVSVTRAADVYSSTTATRAADISTSASTTIAAEAAYANSLQPWYNNTSGTLTSRIIPGARVGGNRAVFVLDDGTQTNRVALYDTGSGNATGRITLNGTESNPSDIASVFVQGVPIKAAAAWSVAGGYTVSTGGKNSTTSIVSAIPSVTTLRIGCSHTLYSGTYNGHIQSTNFYPVRLTNAQLLILTE